LNAAEPGMLAVALVAFGAGLIRGFTGFGGPAFILAILTLFFTPVSIVSKIVVVDFLANAYLFRACMKQINWRATATMVIPTLLAMPIGHWLLIELDPAIMKRAMAMVIATACILMLVGFRYKHPMTTGWLILAGICSGIVFGGSYIALVAVVFILLGPYDKDAGRTLIVAWSFFTVLGFAVIAGVSGTTGVDDIIIAAPGAATYLLGSWLGSHGFQRSSEKLFRRVAISILLALSVFNILS
jgi:uncharacterized membrane protein YfcA